MDVILDCKVTQNNTYTQKKQQKKIITNLFIKIHVIFYLFIFFNFAYALVFFLIISENKQNMGHPPLKPNRTK